MRTKKKQRNSRSKKIKRGTNIKRHVKRRNNIKTKKKRKCVKQKYNVTTKNRNIKNNIKTKKKRKRVKQQYNVKTKNRNRKMKYSKLYGGAGGNWTTVDLPDKEKIRSNPVNGIEGIKNIIEILNFCAIIFKRGLYDIYLNFYKKTVDLFKEKESVEFVKDYPIFELVKDTFGHFGVYFNKSLLEILTDKKFNDIIKELNNTKYKLKKSSIYLTQNFEKKYLNFDDVIKINEYCKNLINKLKIIAKSVVRFRKTIDTILSKSFQTELYDKLQSADNIDTDLFCSCSLFKVLMDQHRDILSFIDGPRPDRDTINEIINKLMLIIVNCFYKLSIYKYRTPDIFKNDKVKDKVIYKVLELTGKLDLNEDTRITELQDRINGLDEQMKLIEADAINLIEAKKPFDKPSENQLASWQRMEEDINSRREKNSQEREKLNSELTSLQSYQLPEHEGGAVGESLSEKLKPLLRVDLSPDNIEIIEKIVVTMESEDKYNKEPFKSMLNKFKKFIEKYNKYINDETNDDNYLLLLGSIKQIRDHKITDDDDDGIIELIKQFVENYKVLPRNTKKEKGLDSKYAYYITLIKNLIIIAKDISNIKVKSLTEKISKFKKQTSGDGVSGVIVTNISVAYKNLNKSITKYDIDDIKSKIDDKYLTFLGTLNIQFGGLNKLINNSYEYKGGGITEIQDIQGVLKSLVSDNTEYKELYLLLEQINNKSVDFSGRKISHSEILENFLGNDNPFSTFYKNLDIKEKKKIKEILKNLNTLINELNKREINDNLRKILELSNIINEQKGLYDHIEKLSSHGLPMSLAEFGGLYGNIPKPVRGSPNVETYTKDVKGQDLLLPGVSQNEIEFDRDNPNIIMLTNLVEQLESLVEMTINESDITTIYEYIENRVHDVFSEYIESDSISYIKTTHDNIKTIHDNIKTYLSIKGISKENKKKLNVYDKLLYLLLNLDEAYNVSCNKFIEKGLLIDESQDDELPRRLEALKGGAMYSLRGGANLERRLIETDETSKTDFIKLFFDLFTNNKLGNNDISNLYEYFPSLKVLILNIYINGISVGSDDNYIFAIKDYFPSFLPMLPEITKLIEELNIKVNEDEKLKRDEKLKESTLKLLNEIKETIFKTYYEALANTDPIDDDTLNLQSKINEILQPLIDNYTDSVKGKIDLNKSDDENIGKIKKAGKALSSISFSSKLKIKNSPYVDTILLDTNFTSNMGIITRLKNSDTVTFSKVTEREIMDDLSELGKVISFCLDSGKTVELGEHYVMEGDIKIENNKTLELIDSLMKDSNLSNIMDNMLSGSLVYIDPLSDQIKQDLIKLSKKIDNLKA